MMELLGNIPDADVLLALEPEELGTNLLLLVKQRYGNTTQHAEFSPSALIQELWSYPVRPNAYPQIRQAEINLALHEAWAWLEAQGLVVPAVGINGNNGFKVLSRRAKRFNDAAELRNYAYSRLIDRTILHPRLRDKVWLDFIRGDFDTAVFLAMKAVEVAVRDKGRYPREDIGTTLMRNAFNPENGRLTDRNAEAGERQAMANLFAGSIGLFKNPHSHRDVLVGTAPEALEVILMANHLLRIVENTTVNQN